MAIQSLAPDRNGPVGGEIGAAAFRQIWKVNTTGAVPWNKRILSSSRATNRKGLPHIHKIGVGPESGSEARESIATVSLTFVARDPDYDERIIGEIEAGTRAGHEMTFASAWPRYLTQLRGPALHREQLQNAFREFSGSLSAVCEEKAASRSEMPR